MIPAHKSGEITSVDGQVIHKLLSTDCDVHSIFILRMEFYLNPAIPNSSAATFSTQAFNPQAKDTPNKKNQNNKATLQSNPPLAPRVHRPR
jgi:hypothetical protein